QCNRTRGSDSPDHCRPDGRSRTFQPGAGHCWNSLRHWRLNQHNAIRTGRRETWPERGVFVYRRHRVARDAYDLVSDAGDKTTDRTYRDGWSISVMHASITSSVMERNMAFKVQVGPPQDARGANGAARNAVA